MWSRNCAMAVKLAPLRDCPARIKNQISVFRFVGIEVIKDDMHFLIPIGVHDIVHKGQKLLAPPPFRMLPVDFPRRHIQGREQGRRAVPFVSVGLAGQGFPAGQLQVTLGRLMVY